MKKGTKKLLTLLVSVIIILSALPITNVFATEIVESGTCGDNLTWTLDDEGSLTISGEGDMWYYNGFIPSWRYNYNMYNMIKNVIIENGVTRIGDSAFYSCSSVTSITIPDSVTSIGYGAFYYCRNLKNAVIPDGVTNIGYEAFFCCSSLTSITIPNGVTFIGDRTFLGCSSLNNVVIGNGVTSISYEAFIGCSSLKSIMIPDSVTIIGESAFGYCENLTSLTIGNSVTSIGDFAFCDCKNLTSVTIGNGVTSLGSGAFSGCSNLSSVMIGKGIMNIGYGAFGDCNNLTSVAIPKNIINIEDYAFGYISDFDNDNIIRIPDFTIYGYKDTAAEKYAIENEFTFIELEKPHEHSFASSITKAPTCTESGMKTYICACGESYNEAIAATGEHIDSNGDGRCDSCEKDLGTKPSENKTFVEKIKDFFQRIIDWLRNLFK